MTTCWSCPLWVSPGEFILLVTFYSLLEVLLLQESLALKIDSGCTGLYICVPVCPKCMCCMCVCLCMCLRMCICGYLSVLKTLVCSGYNTSKHFFRFNYMLMLSVSDYANESSYVCDYMEKG